MTRSTSSILILGQGLVADAVVGRLKAETEGQVVLLETPNAAAIAALSDGIAALVVIAPPTEAPALFLDIDDTRLDAQLTRFADLFECLGVVLGRLDDNGAVLLIGDRGYLGAWGATDAGAFSGAYAALMRCVVLEGFGRGHRANTLALDLAADGADVDADEIARLAAYLVSAESEAINGEIVLANRGRSLRMREAKDRHAALAAVPSKGSPA